MKYSQTHLTIILFLPPHGCPCQKSKNSTTNRAWEMLGSVGKSLLTQILSQLPVKRGVLVSLFSLCSLVPGSSCEGCESPGMSVSGRGPAKAFSWLFSQGNRSRNSILKLEFFLFEPFASETTCERKWICKKSSLSPIR